MLGSVCGKAAVQRRGDFMYIRGPSPPSWASLFTERLVLYLVHTVQSPRTLILVPCLLTLSLSLNSDDYLSLALDSCPCPRFVCSWLDTWSPRIPPESPPLQASVKRDFPPLVEGTRARIWSRHLVAASLSASEMCNWVFMESCACCYGHASCTD